MEPWFRREPWRSVILAVLTALLTIVGGNTVSYWGCAPFPTPPSPQPQPEKPPGKPPENPPDPFNAICKVIMTGGYCSGTIVGPRRPDGRWHIVSAAHCFRRVGESATIVTRAGQTFHATVLAINRQADCAILLTDEVQGLAYAQIAEEIPPVGSKVWHAGYGFDKPGNREEGALLAAEDTNGQLRYRLSVSNGDSGGGIVLDGNGKLLSPVCCTTHIARVGDVWGASPRVIRQMIAQPTQYVGVPPVPMPLRWPDGTPKPQDVSKPDESAPSAGKAS